MEALEYLILACIVLNAAIGLYGLHKIRRVHLATFDLQASLADLRTRHLVDVHQQLQELARLEYMLGLAEPLPATRGWAASPDFLRLVAEHVRQHKPRTVTELGSGTSTIVVARSLQLNGSGHLYSYDHDPVFAAQTRQNLERYGLSDWATVIDAPLGQCTADSRSWKWYSLSKLPPDPIDLLIIDGPPEDTGALARYPAGPMLFPRLAEDGAIFLDDANRPDERKAVKDWLSRFPELRATSLQTEKGCIVLRKAESGSHRETKTIENAAV